MNIDELDNETLQKLGLTQHIKGPGKDRQKPMPKDTVRGHAAAVLGVLAKLTQTDRKRVLEQAIKMNEV
mgnify:CR=1 FL=1